MVFGVVPLVVPQLRTITLGGAVSGLGIESTSFRSGLPRESVLEMSHWHEFDYVVVNRDFDRALAELEAVFDGRGEASRRDRPELGQLTRELLGN